MTSSDLKIFGIVVVIGAAIFSLSTLMPHESKPAVAAEKVSSAPVPTAEPPTQIWIPNHDWPTCLKVMEATPDNERKKVMFVIQNTCSNPVQTFNVSFKLYDATGSRVGWLDDDIGDLQPQEKVRWEMDMPVKDYPLTDRGVARVVLDQFNLKAK